MDSPSGVGFIGLGRIGRFYAANLAGRIPSARLAHIADASEELACEGSERLGGIEWSTDYRAVLKDPEVEAVIVASPTSLHAEMAEAAAASGKQVFCEKPISLDPGRTYEVVEAARDAGVRLQVGLHRRFDPDYYAAWEKISSGEIGEVYLFRASLRDMASPGFDYIEHSGGFFADVTLHDIDAARWLVGEIEEVTASGAALSDPGFEEVGNVDNAVVALHFAGGALGIIDNSRVAGYSYECSSEIMGSRGTLRVGDHRRTAVRTLTPDSESQDHVSDFVERFTEAYTAEMERFVRAIRTGDDGYGPDGSDAAAAFVIAEAASLSHREGRTVRLESELRNGDISYEIAG